MEKKKQTLDFPVATLLLFVQKWSEFLLQTPGVGLHWLGKHVLRGHPLVG